MYSFVVFAILLASAAARPGAEEVVSVHQDTLGNYNLQYVIGGISRVENRDIYGNVNGGYAFIDPHGILRKIEFTSGAHGFNAVGADIPQPVQDTPEVAYEKAHHLAVLNAAYLSAPRIVEAPAFPLASVPAHSHFAHNLHAPLAHSNFAFH